MTKDVIVTISGLQFAQETDNLAAGSCGDVSVRRKSDPAL